MNAESNSGEEPGTQTPPTVEAGCKIEIDRNVLGTGLWPGFAEIIAIAQAMAEEARTEACNFDERSNWDAAEIISEFAKAFDKIASGLRAMSGCEGCKEEEVGD